MIAGIETPNLTRLKAAAISPELLQDVLDRLEEIELIALDEAIEELIRQRIQARLVTECRIIQ